jgi:hypothetical protein
MLTFVDTLAKTFNCRPAEQNEITVWLAPPSNDPSCGIKNFATCENTILLANRSIPTQTGIFGAHMGVAFINDGPVTILMEF